MVYFTAIQSMLARQCGLRKTLIFLPTQAIGKYTFQRGTGPVVSTHIFRNVE